MKTITLTPELSELSTLNEFVLSELPPENIQVNLIVEEIFVNIVNYSKAGHRFAGVPLDGYSCSFCQFFGFTMSRQSRSPLESE